MTETATAPAPLAEHRAEVDALFYRHLAGIDNDSARGALPTTGQIDAERLILDQLARLAATPGGAVGMVPRVPAVIPKLLRSLRDEDMSSSELSRQVAQDVVLVAEVIREANSAHYCAPAPIKTIEGALMLLGQNDLRMLLARVAFRPIISMQAGRFARVVAPTLWRQAEKCAMAASLLAPGLRANPVEAYLGGLLQNIGMVVAFRVIDQIHAAPALPDSDAFCDGLFAQARALSAHIGAGWEFPVTVTSAIAHPGDQGAPALAQTLAAASLLSRLRVLVDAGVVAPDDPFVRDGLAPAALACFEKLRSEDH